MRMLFAGALALVLLGACREELAEAPAPVDLTEEAVSHFCQMNVLSHEGPKGQIHLEGYPAPLFFSQVRDMVAYLKAPERDARILASYVTDMGDARVWDAPQTGRWMAADAALYVVDADVRGGMGAPEIVPFAGESEAMAFIDRHGGRVAALADIPDAAVFGHFDLPLLPEDPA